MTDTPSPPVDLNITVSAMLGGKVQVVLATRTPIPDGTTTLTMNCSPGEAEALARSLLEMADKARAHGGSIQ